eukprot:TRINITY_DN63406_c0_g1_i1.p1 TRINITY_DN63406_c0_g1~~TRINITY_DN63406_c0_g1_i1.p1  ORF type:complete len:940 (-),score=140.96 TRINITY_DN63406_c0_g1_i1:590-3409(-)
MTSSDSSGKAKKKKKGSRSNGELPQEAEEVAADPPPAADVVAEAAQLNGADEGDDTTKSSSAPTPTPDTVGSTAASEEVGKPLLLKTEVEDPIKPLSTADLVENALAACWVLEQAAESDNPNIQFLQRKRNEPLIPWLAHCLGVRDKVGNITKISQPEGVEAVRAVVRGAARSGSVDIVHWLKANNLWQKGYDRDLVERSEEGGCLLKILGDFIVDLSLYPSLATNLYHYAPEELTEALECPRGANVLANFLRVPDDCIVEVMKSIADEMVVFRPLGKEDVTPPVMFELRFPTFLRPLYLKRTLPKKDAVRCTYDKEKRTVQVPSMRNCCFQVSGETMITLPKEVLTTLLIPFEAASFCFVYNDPNANLDNFEGGFLYLNDVGIPIALNSVCFSGGFSALTFGDPEQFSEQAAGEIQKIALPPSAVVVLEAGVTAYAWLGPGEVFADFVASGGGGFAYLFDDPSMNRYFPICGSGAILVRGKVATAWPMNSVNLTKVPSGRDIMHQVTRTGNKSISTKLWGMFNQSVQVPVAISRLGVPDVLSPSLLYAMLTAPEHKILTTEPGKAIATAVFNIAQVDHLQDVLVEMITLVCCGYQIYLLRQHAVGLEDLDFRKLRDHVDYWLVIVLQVLAFSRNVWYEVMLAWAYFKKGWLREYAGNPRTWIEWFTLPPVMIAIVEFAGLEEVPQMRIRPLLAFLCWSYSMKVMYQLRPCASLRMGFRILPVMGALGELVSFMFVMLFFLLSTVLADMALSPRSVLQIISAQYRLGLLGDFAMKGDIYGLEDDFENEVSASPLPWANYQLAFYFIASLIVSLAMTNIFIGVMGNAYAHYQEIVAELFVRVRLTIGLNFLLYNESYKEVKKQAKRRAALLSKELGAMDEVEDQCYVWFCCPREVEPGSDLEEIEKIQERCYERLSDEIKDLKEDIARIRQCLSEARLKE